MPRSRHSRVNLRKSHPGFYHAIMTFGLIQLAAAVNMWFYTPTFQPYDISKYVIAMMYAALGAGLLVFLNVRRDLRKVRVVLAVSIGWSFFWGIANTQQWLAGNSSLQLPIWIVGASILMIPWLIESPVNPMTEQK